MKVYVGLSSHLHEPFLYNSFSLHFTYFALPPQSLIEFFAVAFFKMNRVYSRPSKDSLAIYLLLYIFILIWFRFHFNSISLLLTHPFCICPVWCALRRYCHYQKIFWYIWYIYTYYIIYVLLSLTNALAIWVEDSVFLLPLVQFCQCKCEIPWDSIAMLLIKIVSCG